MDEMHITFEPNKFPLISELLNVLGFTTNAHKYEWEIDHNYKMEWGDDYDDEESGIGGYIDTTVVMVDDFAIQIEAKSFISDENVSYVKHHIKSASLYATHYTLSNTYVLNVSYVYDAGTDKEFAINFDIELDGLRLARKVDAYFENTDAVNKDITFLILSNS